MIKIIHDYFKTRREYLKTLKELQLINIQSILIKVYLRHKLDKIK